MCLAQPKSKVFSASAAPIIGHAANSEATCRKLGVLYIGLPPAKIAAEKIPLQSPCVQHARIVVANSASLAVEYPRVIAEISGHILAP